MNILLIEPDIQLADTYARYLRHSGYTVMIVDTGQRAVEQADILAPDVVILELQLAGHNGFEFLQEFRSHQDWLNIPVIIHTLMDMRNLQQSKHALREFTVYEILSKTATSLDQLKISIQKVMTA